MQLPENAFKAVPVDSDQIPHCPYCASAPTPFCYEHAEEHHRLEEQERTAAREADRLKLVVEDMMAEGVDVYTHSREIRRVERVVGLYLESLRQQVDAAVALKARFFSEAEDRDSKSLAVLEEHTQIVTVFLAALQARADTLEHEPQRDQEATAALPSESPAPAPAPVTVQSGDEPPAYPILEVPHPPYACKSNSRDSGPQTRGDLPGSCGVIRSRHGLRCPQTRETGKRFCSFHCFTHMTDIPSHKEIALEALRTRVACRDRDKARRIVDVKCYVNKLDEMTAIIEEHQRLFSCKSPEDHVALLSDLKMRRTRAGLLLGELNGRTDAKIAESQKRAEAWATEYLAEVKQKDADENRKAAEDLLTGAIITGVSIWFGVPWARSVIAGVVTSLVVRRARDHGANEP